MHLLQQANGVAFHCQQSDKIPAVLFGAANLLPLLLIVPFYDRIIYTWLSGWKWFSMLTRMALGNLFIVASIFAVIAIETARVVLLSETLKGNETVPVLMNAISFRQGVTAFEVASPLTVTYLSIPFLFFVFAEILSNITGKQYCMNSYL